MNEKFYQTIEEWEENFTEQLFDPENAKKLFGEEEVGRMWVALGHDDKNASFSKLQSWQWHLMCLLDKTEEERKQYISDYLAGNEKV